MTDTIDVEGAVERLLKVESSGAPSDWSGIRQVTTNWHRNPDGPEAVEVIRSLQATLRKQREALENFVSGIEQAPISWETGVCCCGNSVDGHGFGDGHSPVDEGVHFVTSLITQARQALSTQPEGGQTNV